MNVIDFSVRVYWRKSIVVGVGIDAAGRVIDMDASDHSNGWDHLGDLVSRGFVVPVGLYFTGWGREVVYRVLREYRQRSQRVHGRTVGRGRRDDVELFDLELMPA